MSFSNKEILYKQLNGFIKRYHQNQLIKGGIYSVGVLIIFFLCFSLLEFFSSFGVWGRTVLFWSFIVVMITIFIKLLALPILALLKVGKTLDYKESAKIIGKHFPSVADKLLNLLELSEIPDTENALISASIKQKTSQLSPIPFKNAISFSKNKKHLKWALWPIFVVLIFIFSGNKYILTESSARIIKHNTFFEPKSPFNYKIENSKLECVQFNDFKLKIKITGRQIPKEVFIKYGKNMLKMNSLGNNEFDFSFLRVHTDINFNFFGGGYQSKTYQVKCLLQPKVVSMKIRVSPPKYTNENTETFKNKADLVVKLGSQIDWWIKFENTNKCSFAFGKDTVINISENNLKVSKTALENTKYSIFSYNNNQLSDTLDYFIKVVPDKFPNINVISSFDSTNSTHIFNGTIEDDYLLEKLNFIYKYKKDDSLVSIIENIKINKTSSDQFFHAINFENLDIDKGSEINYFFRVWDNDEVNGSKFSESKKFVFKSASQNEVLLKIESLNEKTKNSLDKSIKISQEIIKEIEVLKKQILEKKDIGWQEKQKAENIIKKQNQLENQILNTQKKHSENLQNQKKIDMSLQEKHKQLEKLMSNVLDKEMKKLLEEIEKILNNSNKEKLKNILEKLEKENSDLEKELNRELELFKQIEFEQKTEEIIKKIATIKQEQENLKRELDNKNLTTDSLLKNQEKITSKMDSLKKDLQDLREKNMSLENRHQLPKTQELENNITKSMKNSQKSLMSGKKSKSKQEQNKTIEKLEELKDNIESISQSSCNTQQEENMESLRSILENLIKLSFDQEDLINVVKKTPIKSSDFVKIIQKQKKLSQDSKIIEDSLFALSKRVVQIQSKINKEITSVNSNMQKATQELENRHIKKSTTRQQFVMTSTNNLALLLSEILEQMQKEFNSPSNCNKPRNCNNPNKNSNKPCISEIQKAQKKLNQKIKKGGKKGKKIGEKESKELINLAKQQEAIRKKLFELRNELNKGSKKTVIDKILNDMEKNEEDIVNNRISEETFNRQKDIIQKLLDSEISERDQGEKQKRESNEWKFNLEKQTLEMLKYKQRKKTQEELIQTTPVQLTPFYKKKVIKYFNTIAND